MQSLAETAQVDAILLQAVSQLLARLEVVPLVVPVDPQVEVPQSNLSDVTQNANALAVIPALAWKRTCVAALGGPLRIVFVVRSQGVVPNADHATKPEAALIEA